MNMKKEIIWISATESLPGLEFKFAGKIAESKRVLIYSQNLSLFAVMSRRRYAFYDCFVDGEKEINCTDVDYWAEIPFPEES